MLTVNCYGEFFAHTRQNTVASHAFVLAIVRFGYVVNGQAGRLVI